METRKPEEPEVDGHCQAMEHPAEIYPWRRVEFPQPGQRMAIGRQLVECPDYGRLWRRTRDWMALEKAGFFDETTGGKRGRWRAMGRGGKDWITPMPGVAEAGAQPVVLLITGSFAPVHLGHIHLLDQAEGAIMAQGLNLIATYVSPGHDGYVGHKYGGQCLDYSASRRIEQLHDYLADHPSQARRRDGQRVGRLVDPWEAMFNDRPVNFTRVIQHLEEQLTRYWGQRVRVIYGFGADNAGFATAFSRADQDQEIRAVEVGRPGYQGGMGAGKEIRTVLRVEGHSQASSTRQRQIEKQEGRSTETEQKRRKQELTYFIRDDGEYALAPWRERVGEEALAQAWKTYRQQVINILADSLGGEEVKGSARPQIKVLEASEQGRAVERLTRLGAVINLDPVTSAVPGVIPYPVSRVFKLDGAQRRSTEVVTRPGWTKPKEWPAAATLVDDDQATGLSITKAEAYLEGQGVRIKGRYFLVQETEKWDVVDLRDFLPGTQDGGLVVRQGGTLQRVPYLAPWVNLHARARLPGETTWTASQRLWQAAAGFFRRLPVALTVKDMAPESKGIFLRQGWGEGMPMADLCQYWAEALNPKSVVSAQANLGYNHGFPLDPDP